MVYDRRDLFFVKVESYMERSNARQNLLMVLCWAIYTVAYLGRYSYNSSINLIMSDYRVDHASAGLVTTFFFFGYGAGQLINGLLCQKYNKRILFPLVLASSAAINIALYFGVPFVSVKYLWLINAFMQSCLWPSIILIVSQYMDGKHLKRALLLLSTPAPLGTFLAYSASTIFVQIGHYRLSFFVGAAAMVAAAVLWLMFYPQIRVLPLQIVSEPNQKEKDKAGKKCLTMGIGMLVSVLCVFAVIHNFIKDGLQTWVPAILKETQGVSDSLAVFLSLLLPLLGIFGAMISLAAEKKICNLVLLCTGAFAIAVPLILLVAKVLSASIVVSLISFGVVVLLMHAINSVITSIAPLRLRSKTNSGRMAGILNACCYVGSTISSYLLGLIADSFGWNTVVNVLLMAAILAVILGAAFILVQRRKSICE